MTLHFKNTFGPIEAIVPILERAGYKLRSQHVHGDSVDALTLPGRAGSGPWIVPLEDGLVAKVLTVPPPERAERYMRVEREWLHTDRAAKLDQAFGIAALPSAFPESGHVLLVMRECRPLTGSRDLEPRPLHAGLYRSSAEDLITRSVHGRAEAILQLMLDVARELTFLAERSHVGPDHYAHRDLKRGNIVLDDSYRPAVGMAVIHPRVLPTARPIDYGLVTTADGENLTENLPDVIDKPRGTVANLAPEVGFDPTTGEDLDTVSLEHQTPKGDVWALGTIAAELWAYPAHTINGKKVPNPHATVNDEWILLGDKHPRNAWARHRLTPQPKDDASAVLALLTDRDQADRDQPDLRDLLDGERHRHLLSTMPRQLRAIVSRCLHPTPAHRPTMAQVRDVVARILDGDQTHKLGPERTDPTEARIGDHTPDGPYLPYTKASGVGNPKGRQVTVDPSLLTFDCYGEFVAEQVVVDATYVAAGIYRTARQRTDIEAAMWSISETSEALGSGPAGAEVASAAEQDLARIAGTPAGQALISSH